MRTFLMSFFVSLVVVLGSKYAYTEWLQNQTVLEIGDVVSSPQRSVTETLSAPAGQRLVPTGAILGINDVDVVRYTYSLTVQAGNELDVSAANVVLTKAQDTISDSDGVLSFSYEVEMVNPTLAFVTVLVRLNMPSSEAEYERLQGSQVSFQIRFDQHSLRS